METLAVILILAVALALLLPIAFFFYITVVLALMVGWSYGQWWGWATFGGSLSLAIYDVSRNSDTFGPIGWVLVAAPLVLWGPVVGHGRRKREKARAELIERMRAQKKTRPRGPKAARTGGMASAVRYVNSFRSGR